MNLYRKYRPQKFSDLYAQEHVVQTLTSALASGSFSHAYLFSGPKGSGKTTTARLLAKALNCQGRVLSRDAYEPCNKCVSCREISEGKNLDLIEIDAASNRGIDEIRELRDKIRFAPNKSQYKIYIIDECHMLTKEAFNALLKTLEEPPKHAIFILATTELHKVLPTILSRTQSFEFRKASPEEIIKLLKKIVKAEDIRIQDQVLELIARLSFGAFRDAVTMLDQVSSLGIDKRHTISTEEAQEVLGQANEELVWKFVENLAQNNLKAVLKVIEEIYFVGKDMENFTHGVIALFRKALLVRSGIELKYELTREEKKRLEDITAKLNKQEFIFIIERLARAAISVRSGSMGQLPLEMAAFEIIKTQNSIAESQNLNLEPINKEKLEVIESRVKTAEPIIQKKDSPENKTAKSEPKISTNASVSESTLQAQFSPEKWPEVIKVVKSHNNAIAAMIKNTRFYKTNDHQIILAVKFKFHAEQICAKKNLVVIEKAIFQVAGEQYKVDCMVDKDLDLKKPQDAEEEILNGATEVFEVEEN